MTDFVNKTNILGDFWTSYRNEPGFEEFVSYNDLGLPLAFAISEAIVDPTPSATELIEETFAMLLATLNIAEDGEYESVNDMLADAAMDE